MKYATLFSLLCVLCITGYPLVLPAAGPDNHDHQEEEHTLDMEHEDQDHGKGERHEESGADQHQDESDGHDHEEDELSVQVSDSGMSMAGISISAITERVLSQFVELPGEIGFNEDRLAHITPRYGGVVKEVLKGLGAFVRKGEILAVIESNQSLAAYQIRAPLDGRIVEKHAIPGEYVTEEVSIFVIADLSTVWVNLDVYPRHLKLVTEGRAVRVKAVSLEQEAHGIVSYVAPLFDTAKRAAVAHVVLANAGDSWRPGMFVQAELEIHFDHPVPAVETDAIQMIDGETHVFVPAGPNRFRPVEVTVGRKGRDYVEVVSGIGAGERYVALGAFELKAKMITSSLGAHAGHGH